ncbi:MAG: type IV pilus assembly protein PilM [Actinobacteria bacterium]|nr:type IV pilus assembly protein PilM [Actinomycetota bacterium]
MVDLKKEIKLSELMRRPKKAQRPSIRPRSTGASRRPKQKKTQEIIGLKIGASQLAAARILNEGGSAKLMQLARQPLPPGIVIAGDVRDVPALGWALDEFFTENKLPRKGIRLGIGTNRVGVRAIEVEGIADEHQLENAVRFRAHEALSIPIDEAVLDYHVVKETVDDAGAVSRRVILAAAYREPIDQYVEACRIAKLELFGVDLEAFALLRAVTSGDTHGEQPAAAVVALALGHDRATLAISDGNLCDFTRVLAWGGGKLDAAIGRDLGLTEEESNEIKHELFLGDEVRDGDDPRTERARKALQPEIQTLARELVASLQFYQSQEGSLPISEILVTGGTSRLPGLIEELERLTRARVRAADPLASVLVARGVGDRDDLASLATAIGLGIER